MTTCSFNRLTETEHADPQERQQRDAALRNSRHYFDDWTATRPASEWPAPSGVSATRRTHSGQGTGDVPVVPAPEVVSADAGQGRELVHVRSLSSDILGSISAPQPTDAAVQSGVDGRRKHKRVHGPFDGIRVGALETPVQLYDLSRGGCFINSIHHQQPGVRLVLKLDLPQEGWIAVRAETLERRGELGFAVRFVEVSEDAAARLDRAMLAMEQRDQDV